YPQYNQTEIWQNDLGYGDFFMQQSTENQPLKVALNGVFELGGKWNLGNGKWLYSGVFADYGLFDLLKSKKAMERTVEYNRQTPENPIINSVLQNTKLQPFSIGLKLKFAFSFEKSNKKSIDIQDVEKIDEDFFEF
ncbi:MAG: hypothetical protein LBN95_04080, partial [Prevotellaceae bacterium]|nr:hypothetical protein [Prevotellaceae bacterium]